MKNVNIGYFPESPPKELHPQLLAVEHQGMLYRLQLETFHLYENAISMQNPPEHSHDVFHIVLYRAGDNIFKLDGKQRQSHSDTLVLVSPGIPHCFTPMLPRESVYHEITFSLVAQGQKLVIPFADLFSKYYGNAIKSEKMLIKLDAASAVQLEEFCFELSKKLSEYDSASSFPVYQRLVYIFELLFQKVFDPKADESSKQHIESKLQKTRSHIEQKLNDKLSLKDLAVIVGMSPEHFCREFKKVYGEPPLEMRNRLRINAAIKLLQYSDHPIKQISEDLGYSDVYHFSKAFKKQTKLSPGKFRQLI
ncbi:MAG: helix-turn-helix transcriptional regulator [Victivallaceae bacterium]|nr:helix-turn-helix transcriptional regulator [Victivallaceae bacterium]